VRNDFAPIQTTKAIYLHERVALYCDRKGAKIQVARSVALGTIVIANLKAVGAFIQRQTMNEKSLQETYAPQMACFGCGPANEKGLHIRSFPDGDEVVATFEPEEYQEAFPGMLSGGIIGTLLDCHCNWAAAYHLMKKAGADHPPCTVTADYTITLKRPTPTDQAVTMRARVIESTDDRATVAGELIAHDKVTATCRGTFVAVKPGHPAYHRW
jgi:acyl-coenzyme A thioesterase PaaI-like protein